MYIVPKKHIIKTFLNSQKGIYDSLLENDEEMFPAY